MSFPSSIFPHRIAGNVGLVYALEMGRTGADDEICLPCIFLFLGGAIFLLSFVADRQAKLGAAKALGLELPATLVARADEVIE